MKWCTRDSETNVIKFRSKTDFTWNVKERPVPASKRLPNWWGNIPHYIHGATSVSLEPVPNVTVKRCMSALDGLGAGYIMPLWSDVQVTYDKINGTAIKWATTDDIFGTWISEQVGGYKFPEEYAEPVFKYFHDWLIETPPGWSCLITQPFGYPDLPFHVIPGIVDTDRLKTGIETPIVFKKGWTGILEKGTPMFQIIPIKRSAWQSEFVQGSEKEYIYETEKLRTKIVSYYGRYLRVPKVFK
jgi:hypothetical protein